MRMLNVWIFVASIAVVTPAYSQTAKRNPPTKNRDQRDPVQSLAIADLELGKTGFLTFPVQPGKPTTLLPLKIEGVDEDSFVASLTSSSTGKRWAVLVRGVNTEGLISGRFVQLSGEVKVADTTEISNGETVFVLEPTEPNKFTLQKSASPELVRPR